MSRLTYTLIIGAVVLVALGSLWVAYGGSRPASQAISDSTSTAGPTAVPTLDFFRGRSYPTPTPQPIGSAPSASA